MIADSPFVAKASNTGQSVCVVDAMGPTMVSVAKVIDNEHSTLNMPSVEFAELGLCGTVYYVESLSQKRTSMTNATDNLHDHAEIYNVDVPTMKHFASKERHPLMLVESIAHVYLQINNPEGGLH